MNLYRYLLLIILCFGVFGNVMTIIIMRRLKSDESTINIYFTAVAAMDLMYLCIVKTAGKFLSKGESEQVQARKKAARSVTVTVSIVSIAFLVLTLPATIDYILNFFQFQMANFDSMGYSYAEYTLIGSICEIFYHTNAAINFYLYCLTGKRFREEFIKIMCCGRNR
ncbi:hypothetical protein ACOMHN_039892 [Nucella lapillus]